VTYCNTISFTANN